MNRFLFHLGEKEIRLIQTFVFESERTINLSLRFRVEASPVIKTHESLFMNRLFLDFENIGSEALRTYATSSDSHGYTSIRKSLRKRERQRRVLADTFGARSHLHSACDTKRDNVEEEEKKKKHDATQLRLRLISAISRHEITTLEYGNKMMNPPRLTTECCREKERERRKKGEFVTSIIIVAA